MEKKKQTSTRKGRFEFESEAQKFKQYKDPFQKELSALDLGRQHRRENLSARSDEVGWEYFNTGEDYCKHRQWSKAADAYGDAINFFSSDKYIAMARKSLNSIVNFGKPVKNYFAIFAISFLLISLVFMSFSITGNVLGLGTESSRWIAICFFICGLAFSFFYLKGRK